MTMTNLIRLTFLLIGISFALTLPASGDDQTTTPANHKLLMQIVAVGGLTPHGLGRSEVRAYSDGALESYRITDDQTKARGSEPTNPGAFDGWYKAQLTKQELDELRESVTNIDLSALKLNTQARRPSSADGSDMTATFHVKAGAVSVPLWQLPRDQPLKPVTILFRLNESHFKR